MTTKAFRLTDAERTTIVNALTVAARQYERDAEQALELALHGMTIREPAEALAAQLRQHAVDARQLRDKITFLWEHVQF
jgi:rubrerythrin